MMSSFDPHLTDSKGVPYKKLKYNQIIEDQTTISYYCNISYEDTENMSPYERDKILSTLHTIMELEMKAKSGK